MSIEKTLIKKTCNIVCFISLWCLIHTHNIALHTCVIQKHMPKFKFPQNPNLNTILTYIIPLFFFVLIFLSFTILYTHSQINTQNSICSHTVLYLVFSIILNMFSSPLKLWIHCKSIALYESENDMVGFMKITLTLDDILNCLIGSNIFSICGIVYHTSLFFQPPRNWPTIQEKNIATHRSSTEIFYHPNLHHILHYEKHFQIYPLRTNLK